MLSEVPVVPRDLDRFSPLVGDERLEEIRTAARSLIERLDGRPIWTLNTTAAGGGVAEMLHPLLGYCRGLGVDARWLIVGGRDGFFRITKRLHNALHGSSGDGSDLGDAERRIYEDILAENAEDLLQVVSGGDVVILHDPQTAGLIPHLDRIGAKAIWRCHIGGELGHREVARGWRFLQPYLEPARAFVFSRREYVPPFCPPDRTVIIHPSIDPFSVKNQDLDEEVVRSILVQADLVAGPNGHCMPSFTREDGTTSVVVRHADVVRRGAPPSWDSPLVVQVSRWDRLKDPAGVMSGFVRSLEGANGTSPHLILAGPSVKEVADDPEGAEVYRETVEAWGELQREVRERIHLATVPMDDLEENAAIINALQRHAAVVVQKSLQEGFGLTVTEAMWKARPVVASAVGGIKEQIADGVSGLLVPDPTDTDAFAGALARIYQDPGLARRISQGARDRVKKHFLGMRSLMQYSELLNRILD